MTSFNDARAYLGKLDHPPYAVNENFVISFPRGLEAGAPVWVFSTWTKHSDGTEKKSFIDIKGIADIGNENRFSVKGIEYYAFDGVFPVGGDGKTLEVTLKGDRGFVVKFDTKQL
ncbi:hypothetical protein FIBSPDRAFT_863097 [Athelia psychrophila]|uniref:Uncharacterized protein n=1 Tax=Athelia psychrophila TaxID=1759441 RepID=A0A166HS06_9AGAM|nr:hypothetical protein FIBSPDRAFT_863097 [Fibularhizoctonia sp. CBS 109695]